MKVVIIGGVAAGTQTAAKLLREDRSHQVKIITKSKDISYAGCGLPYYVGHVIATMILSANPTMTIPNCPITIGIPNRIMAV